MQEKNKTVSNWTAYTVSTNGMMMWHGKDCAVTLSIYRHIGNYKGFFLFKMKKIVED